MFQMASKAVFGRKSRQSIPNPRRNYWKAAGLVAHLKSRGQETVRVGPGFKPLPTGWLMAATDLQNSAESSP